MSQYFNSVNLGEVVRAAIAAQDDFPAFLARLARKIEAMDAESAEDARYEKANRLTLAQVLSFYSGTVGERSGQENSR